MMQNIIGMGLLLGLVAILIVLAAGVSNIAHMVAGVMP